MVKTIGILTSGGDSPGLNAAIRGVGKAAIGAHGMHVVAIGTGFVAWSRTARRRLPARSFPAS